MTFLGSLLHKDIEQGYACQIMSSLMGSHASDLLPLVGRPRKRMEAPDARKLHGHYFRQTSDLYVEGRGLGQP